MPDYYELSFYQFPQENFPWILNEILTDREILWNWRAERDLIIKSPLLSDGTHTPKRQLLNMKTFLNALDLIMKDFITVNICMLWFLASTMLVDIFAAHIGIKVRSQLKWEAPHWHFIFKNLTSQRYSSFF